MKTFKIKNKEILEGLVNKGLEIKEISNTLNLSISCIATALKRFNLNIPNPRISKSIPISNRQYEILAGTLLGDSSLISKSNKYGAYFSCSHCEKQFDYLEWKHKELESLHCSMYDYDNIDLRYNKIYKQRKLRTLSSIELFEIKKQLYIDRIKIIPNYLLNFFSELSLAVMFMDDGTKLKNSILICTNCFTVDDLNLFNEFCYNKWNIKFNIHKNHTLYLPAIYYPKFKEIVLPHMHECMLYKLH